MNNRAKACDIPISVKRAVWERDGHRCIVCGSYRGAFPNAHYIRRSRGGLGVEQNIVTLCGPNGNNCHRRYDEGTADEQHYYKEVIKKYLMKQYPGWDEKKLIFKKRGRPKSA